MRKFFFALVLSIVGFNSSASSLGLVLGIPDISSNNINVSYNSTTDILTATGYASTLDLTNAPGVTNILDGTFTLTAVINDAGVASSGSLLIAGDVYDSTATTIIYSGTVLSGTLSDFGYVSSLEFIFNNTAGNYASLYPKAGVILSNTGFTGSFTNSFTNFVSITAPVPGVADTVPVASVPTPAALPAGLTLLAGFAVLKLRKKA